jgi:asparagine N-glycosylation enzyme membrane subunit Stt3
LARQPRFAPPEAWCESLTWLRDNTPEPFGDADFYYSRYDAPFDYSNYPNAYGVMAWWDYGYWIVRIGHRPPSQNPGGVIPAVAQFFVAQNETDGEKVLDDRGARYIILDYEFITGKFYGAIDATGESQQDYYDYFVVTDQQGKSYLQPYYFPEFYRSMSVRLYCFEGKAVTPAPGDCKVISWTLQGQYKVITHTESCDSYQAALTYAAGLSSSNYNIVSSSPFVSAVPLEEVKGIKLCHDSPITEGTGTSTIPQVCIFEYMK